MPAICFHANFMRGLRFDPEDGGDVFLWNVSWLLTDYTALSILARLDAGTVASNPTRGVDVYVYV
jgi:hypothetical protein